MVGSVNFQMEEGRFGLGTDLVASKGYRGQPDMYGLQFMPSMYLDEAKRFQAVFRYTYINSDGENGIRLGRYENSIVSGRGDEYNEFYAGLNWYLYGHKLKFQTGVQYTTVDDGANDGGEYDGWGVTTGIRISW
jgi:phosphate-selective porin OprO/OprP